MFKATPYVELEFALRKDGLLFFLTPALDNQFLCDLKQSFVSADLRIEMGESYDKKYFYYDCPFRENANQTPFTN